MSNAVDPECYDSQDVGEEGKSECQAVRYPEVMRVVIVEVGDAFSRDVGLDKGSI